MKIRERTQAALIATATRVIDRDVNADEASWEEILASAQLSVRLLQEDTRSQDDREQFDGPEYNPGRDDPRLESQLYEIFRIMSDGKYRTVRRLAQLTNYPENSIQAQLRHLRKAKHGAWIVVKNRRDEESNLFYYQLRNPDGSRVPPVRPDALHERRVPEDDGGAHEEEVEDTV